MYDLLRFVRVVSTGLRFFGAWRAAAVVGFGLAIAYFVFGLTSRADAYTGADADRISAPGPVSDASFSDFFAGTFSNGVLFAYGVAVVFACAICVGFLIRHAWGLRGHDDAVHGRSGSGDGSLDVGGGWPARDAQCSCADRPVRGSW